MLEREGNNILQPLESRISMSVANTLSDDNLDPSKILGCIGPHLREHFRMKRREPKLATVVGFINILRWINMGYPLVKGVLRELISKASCVSIEGSEAGIPLTQYLRP